MGGIGCTPSSETRRVSDGLHKSFALVSAVDPESNEVLHTTLEPTRTNAISYAFVAERREKHDVDDAVFLVDGATPLKHACSPHSLDCRYQTHGTRNSVERVFRKVKRRTSSFANCFSHVDPDTADD